MTGNVDGNESQIQTLTMQAGDLTWAAGECKTWTGTWDQRIDGRPPAPAESFTFRGRWNGNHDVRSQRHDRPVFRTALIRTEPVGSRRRSTVHTSQRSVVVRRQLAT